MYIKKNFQGEIPANKIMGTYTESDTDTYNCDYINERNAIMVNLASSKYITASSAWGFYNIPFNNTVANIGNKFKLELDGSVSYTGNKPLKITVHITREDSNTAGTLYPVNSQFYYYQEATSLNNSSVATQVSVINPTSKIYGQVRNSGTGTIALYGGDTYTYMLIEEL